MEVWASRDAGGKSGCKECPDPDTRHENVHSYENLKERLGARSEKKSEKNKNRQGFPFSIVDKRRNKIFTGRVGYKRNSATTVMFCVLCAEGAKGEEAYFWNSLTKNEAKKHRDCTERREAPIKQKAASSTLAENRQLKGTD